MTTPVVGLETPATVVIEPPWSLAVSASGDVFVSGQAGLGPSGEVVSDDVGAQTTRALDRLAAVLAAADLGFEHVTRWRVFVDSHDSYRRLKATLRGYGGGPNLGAVTAGAVVVVDSFPIAGVRVEIDAVACRTPSAQRRTGKDGSPVFVVGRSVRGAEKKDGWDVRRETAEALRAIESSLQDHTLPPRDIVKLSAYIGRDVNYDEFAEALGAYVRSRFDGVAPPVFSCFRVDLSDPAGCVEFEAVASTGERVGISNSSHIGHIPRSDVIRAGRWVFLAADGRSLGGEGRFTVRDVRAEALSALEQARAMIEAVGGNFANIIHVTTWLREPRLYDPLNEVRVPYYREHFPKADFPAGTAVVGHNPETDPLVSLDVVAHLDGD